MRMVKYLFMVLTGVILIATPLLICAQENELMGTSEEESSFPSTIMIDEETTPSEEIVDIGVARRIIGGEKVDIGKEMEEPGSAFKLFENREDIERMLGKKPRFVYNPKDLPDPMIVPWIRRDVVVREILDAARKHAAKGNFTKAQQLLNKAIADYPDSRHINSVKAELKKLERMQERGIASFTDQEELIVLPSWVPSHTSGILWTEDKPIVLVGDSLLSQGDSIPKYPNISIHKINKQEVIYSYRDRLFPVEVHGNK